jgi:hypothetical protein
MSVFLCGASFLLNAGCGGEAHEAWNTAYLENYDRAYQAAEKTTNTRGNLDGIKVGSEEAKQAADKGFAWQLYKPMACWSLLFGALVGIFVQYAILFTCNKNQHLPRPGMFALVPAIKRSLCYSIFDQRFRLMIALDAQLERIRTEKNRKIAEAEATHEVLKRRIKAAASIEELATARLIELTEAELAEVVAIVEHKHQDQQNQKNKKWHLRNVCTCQNCGGRVKVPRKSAGTTITCPYRSCGHPIKVPSG